MSVESLHDLVQRLDRREGNSVSTSFGPRHPEHPTSRHAPAIAACLDQYPFLRRDLGYADYLECYAGLSVTRDRGHLSVNIFGFDEHVSSHLIDRDGWDVIEPDGMMLIGVIETKAHPDATGFDRGVPTLALSYAFDSTLKRRWGIYRKVRARPAASGPFEWYCETFLDLLERIVEHDGRPLDGVDLDALSAAEPR